MKKTTTTTASETKPARARKTKSPKTSVGKKKVRLPLYCGRKNPFTPEAWEWVNKENVWPGTEKPLCFLQPTMVFEIAEAQQRTLSLDEVQTLVFPEGPKAEMCALSKEAGEEIFFTPLNYAYAVSLKGIQQIENGIPLKEVKGIFRGGPYYVNKNRTEAKAFSGSPLRFNIAKGTYWRNGGSPLVIMAVEKGTPECPVWGVPFSEIEHMIEVQARKTALHMLASKMASNLTNGREGRRRERTWRPSVGDQVEKAQRKAARRPSRQRQTAEVE